LPALSEAPAPCSARTGLKQLSQAGGGCAVQVAGMQAKLLLAVLLIGALLSVNGERLCNFKRSTSRSAFASAIDIMHVP
jgi:hypothetical protein